MPYHGIPCENLGVATIILSLADLGTAMPLQELLEQSGHHVTWDAASANGPMGLDTKPDVVILDAEDKGCVNAAVAWRDHDPPPGVLMVGTGEAAHKQATAARCHFVPNNASGETLEVQLKAVLHMRFAGRMSGPYARAILGLGPSLDPSTDAARIVKGSRTVSLEVVRECLRWHAHEYVIAGEEVVKLRQARALYIPEVEVCNQLDGTITVRRLVSGTNGEMVGKLLWGLLSCGAASSSMEPPDQRTPERKHISIMRRHLRARNKRLAEATHYEVLEVTPDANAQRIDHAARTLAMRYAPDLLERIDLGDVASLVPANWQRVLQARQTLMDPASRGRYNDTLDANAQASSCPWAFQVEDAALAEEFFRRGRGALVAGEAFKAVSHLAGACRNHPDHPTYEAYLCWARFRAGVERDQDRGDLAHKERSTAELFLLGRRPWPDALVALALLCAANADPDSARYYLKEALAINPNLPVAKQLLGRLC